LKQAKHKYRFKQFADSAAVQLCVVFSVTILVMMSSCKDKVIMVFTE